MMTGPNSFQKLLPEMRLFNSGLVVLSITLLSQLCFLAALSWQLAGAEHDIWIESRANQLTARAGSVLRNFYECSTMLFGYALTRSQSYSDGYDKSVATFHREAASTWAMLAGSPNVSTRLLKECQQVTGKAITALDDIKRTIDSHTNRLSIADLRELGGELKEAVGKYFDVISLVAAQDSKTRQDLVQSQSRARSVVKLLIAGGFVLDVLISLSILYLWIHGVTNRLNVVNENARRLGAGKEFLPALQGRDEIAEVDRVFHEVYDKLKEADELKKEFNSLISHELRSPLSSVSATISLAEVGVFGEMNERGKQSMYRAGLSLKRLLNLINELLDIHKMEAGKFQLNQVECELKDVVEVSVEEVRALAEAKQIELKVRTDSAKMVADPERLEQVVINFLANAVKYTPNGGSIAITAAEEAGLVTVRVTDTGSGISDDFQEKAFGKYEQATGTRGGTGLGLFICKSIIEQHGGEIGVENVPSGGACFWFKIPLST